MKVKITKEVSEYIDIDFPYFCQHIEYDVCCYDSSIINCIKITEEKVENITINIQDKEVRRVALEVVDFSYEAIHCFDISLYKKITEDEFEDVKKKLIDYIMKYKEKS